MRSLLALLAIILLSVGATACGSTSKSTVSTSQVSSTAAQPPSNTTATASTTASTATSTTARHEPKGENDNDDHTHPPAPADDVNHASLRNSGHAPNAADAHAIRSLLNRYYAIALAGNGAKACAMIDSGLVKAVPLDYGKLGAPYLRGAKTCAAVLALLFKHEHRVLSAEVPQLKLLSVRLEGNNGMVLLGFGKLPERQITVIHQRGVWKLAVLLDGEVT